jgi:hypothetical protein
MYVEYAEKYVNKMQTKCTGDAEYAKKMQCIMLYMHRICTKYAGNLPGIFQKYAEYAKLCRIYT